MTAQQLAVRFLTTGRFTVPLSNGQTLTIQSSKPSFVKVSVKDSVSGLLTTAAAAAPVADKNAEQTNAKS